MRHVARTISKFVWDGARASGLIAGNTVAGATGEAAEGGGRYCDRLGDAVAGPTLSAQGDDAVDDGLRGAARAMTGPRRAIVETG